MSQKITNAKRLREAFRAIKIAGRSENPEGYGPPYGPPWQVIDVRSAEPEVNWPGELISEHQNFPDADIARWEAVWENFYGGR